MNTRFGCFSGIGLVASLIAILLIGGMTLARGGILFNPGPLNAQAGGQVLMQVRSHADIQGCSACHPAFWEKDRLSDRCLDCHTGVAAQLQEASGLHGYLRTREEQNCRICHTEHHGTQAALTRPGVLSGYPHEEFGFALAAHTQMADGQPFACADCHTTNLSEFTPGVCAGCHRDLDAPYMRAHIDDFGEVCMACHDGLDTYGQRFDHQALAFPLLGRHSQADCTACHAGARSQEDLRSAPHTCFDCHAAEDIHTGEFGQDCAACHTPDRWEGAVFDHSLTGFPLTGAHLDLVCSRCHQEGPSGTLFKGTPSACAGCHAEPEYHAGLFGSDCETCHITAAWSPAAYERPHTFPLDHGESGVSSCRTCHPAGLGAYTCYGCHEHSPAEIENEHREEGIRDFQDCTRCHPTGREEEGEREGGD